MLRLNGWTHYKRYCWRIVCLWNILQHFYLFTNFFLFRGSTKSKTKFQLCPDNVLIFYLPCNRQSIIIVVVTVSNKDRFEREREEGGGRRDGEAITLHRNTRICSCCFVIMIDFPVSFREERLVYLFLSFSVQSAQAAVKNVCMCVCVFVVVVFLVSSGFITNLDRTLCVAFLFKA